MEFIINSIVATGIGLVFWAIWFLIGYKSITFFLHRLLGKKEIDPFYIIWGTIGGIATFIVVAIGATPFLIGMDL